MSWMSKRLLRFPQRKSGMSWDSNETPNLSKSDLSFLCLFIYLRILVNKVVKNVEVLNNMVIATLIND